MSHTPRALSPVPVAAWLILAAGSVVLALNLGIRQTLGLFLPDMAAATGWGLGPFALAMAIQNLLWGLASPVAGILADRYGTAKTVAVGGLLYAGGLAWMAVASSQAALHASAGLVLGLGVAATTFPIVLGAIGRCFPPEKRSLALGIASAGGSFGQAAMAWTATGLIDGYGWFDALLIIAGIALIMVPLGLALAGKAVGTHATEQSIGAAIKEANAHGGYRLLNAGFFVCGFHVAFIAVHLPGYVASCGLPSGVGAMSLAVIGLGNIVGTLLAGALGGRYSKPYLLSGIYALRVVAIVALLLAPKTEATFLVFSAVMGVLWLSTVPLTSGIVAQVFGPAYLATLFGIVMFSHQLGGFFGAWAGGLAWDITGSYDAVWWISAALGAFAALVHLPIKDAPLRRAAAV